MLASAREKARYGLDYYFVGDEGSLTSYTDAFDYCWGPYTLAAFRTWLKQQYGSLAALNQEWKTDFQDWEAVVPLTTEEAQESGNYPPWADHRTFMEVDLRGRLPARARRGRRRRPGGAHRGLRHPGHHRLRRLRLVPPGSGDRRLPLLRRRQPVGPAPQLRQTRRHGRLLDGIWFVRPRRPERDLERRHPPRALPTDLLARLLPEPRLHALEVRGDMGEAFRTLRYQGIGKLFLESERFEDGIALHFSMPSVHAAAIHPAHGPQEGDPTRTLSSDRGSWVTAIDDLGLQLDFVADQQVARGILGSSKYRVLILPLSTALSPAEAKAIQAFAERGGIVIVDAGAGVMDDHCAWLEQGALNGFFGISAGPSSTRHFAHLPAAVSVTEAGKTWGLDAGLLANLGAAQAIKTSTGAALLKVGDNDAVVVHQVGKGWAIYLNLLLDGYGRQRRDHYGGDAYHALIGGLLAHLGVRPAVQVLDADGRPLAQAQVVRYRFGNAEALAIVKENVGVQAVEGRDGVTVFADANLGQVASQEITVRLPRAFHVTDARTGKRLGDSDTVKTAITVGGALVLGLARPRTLSLSAARPPRAEGSICSSTSPHRSQGRRWSAATSSGRTASSCRSTRRT